MGNWRYLKICYFILTVKEKCRSDMRWLSFLLALQALFWPMMDLWVHIKQKISWIFDLTIFKVNLTVIILRPKNSSSSYVGPGLKRAGYEVNYQMPPLKTSQKVFLVRGFEAILMPNYGTLCIVKVYFVIYVDFLIRSTNFNLSSAPQQPRNEPPSRQDCDISLFTKACASGK